MTGFLLGFIAGVVFTLWAFPQTVNHIDEPKLKVKNSTNVDAIQQTEMITTGIEPKQKKGFLLFRPFKKKAKQQ